MRIEGASSRVRDADAELADFIDCVRHKRAPLVGGRTALEALRVALLVKEKIASCQS